jgi:hypothetical protein
MYEDRMAAAENARREREKREQQDVLRRRLSEVEQRHRLTFECLELVDPIYGHVLRVVEDPSGVMNASIVLLAERDAPEVQMAVYDLAREMEADEARGKELWFSVHYRIEPRMLRP